MWGNVGGHNLELIYFSSEIFFCGGGGRSGCSSCSLQARIQFESREKEKYELHGGFLKNSICHSDCLYFRFNYI